MNNTNYRILLVDDDADLLSLLKFRLKSSGFEVATAQSGEEALGMMSAVNPDVVITDLRMPGMDGMELFKAIRTRNKTIPVIIITAHGSIPEAVESTRQGVYSFLTKPIDGKELIRLTEKALKLSTAETFPKDGTDEWRSAVIP